MATETAVATATEARAATTRTAALAETTATATALRAARAPHKSPPLRRSMPNDPIEQSALVDPNAPRARSEASVAPAASGAIAPTAAIAVRDEPCNPA